MTIEEALVAKLESLMGLTALIGSRLYPDAVPQDQTTWPCLVYHPPKGDETPYVSGEANDLHRDEFELETVSPLRTDAGKVRDALVAALNGIAARGLWHPTVFVSGCIVADTSGMAEQPKDGSERRDRKSSVFVTVIWGNR